jgi:hypothetical protein
VLLVKSYSVDQIKKNEMGGASGMYGGKKGAYRVLVGSLVEGDYLEDLVTDGRVILK